ncbi:MAG: nitrilase-related carbon-nitrogen hydrolase [Eubacteriales bacterium]|nr:nitrilase-related carbon-nitrogen hydrolase [Eubacteriales bacterium]
MKLALAQMQIEWENKEANLQKVTRYLELLSHVGGADLFALPEMSLTGFSPHTDRTKEKNRESVTQMTQLSRRFQTAIGVGWVRDTGALCENHYSIVTPHGETILDYAKLHPFRYGGEDRQFRGGGDLPVCGFGDFQIGVQICYDLRFPEPFQILSKTASLILVPANWPAPRREAWLCLLRARAIENQAYLAGINCAGQIGGLAYTGDSCLYAPDGSACTGEILRLPGAPEGEQLLLFSLENDTARIRREFPVKQDRREDLYAGFYRAADDCSCVTGT